MDRKRKKNCTLENNLKLGINGNILVSVSLHLYFSSSRVCACVCSFALKASFGVVRSFRFTRNSVRFVSSTISYMKLRWNLNKHEAEILYEAKRKNIIFLFCVHNSFGQCLQ